MKKSINENTINNPLDVQELKVLFVFERLAQLEDEISREDIIAFFSHRFNTDIRPGLVKQLETEIKNTLQRIRINNFKNNALLHRYGYTSNEE